jgi:hypothetical protein
MELDILIQTPSLETLHPPHFLMVRHSLFKIPPNCINFNLSNNHLMFNTLLPSPINFFSLPNQQTTLILRSMDLRIHLTLPNNTIQRPSINLILRMDTTSTVTFKTKITNIIATKIATIKMTNRTSHHPLPTDHQNSCNLAKCSQLM